MFDVKSTNDRYLYSANNAPAIVRRSKVLLGRFNMVAIGINS